jgi:hypothetical protein
MAALIYRGKPKDEANQVYSQIPTDPTISQGLQLMAGMSGAA